MGWFTNKLQNGRIAMHQKQLNWDFQKLNAEQIKKLAFIMHLSIVDILRKNPGEWFYELPDDLPRQQLMCIIDEMEDGIRAHERIQIRNTGINIYVVALRLWICLLASRFSKGATLVAIPIVNELEKVHIIFLSEQADFFVLANNLANPNTPLDSLKIRQDARETISWLKTAITRIYFNHADS